MSNEVNYNWTRKEAKTFFKCLRLKGTETEQNEKKDLLGAGNKLSSQLQTPAISYGKGWVIHRVETKATGNHPQELGLGLN